MTDVFELEQVRSVCGAKWLQRADKPVFLKGVGIDSREDLAHKIFIAIKGETHDGHAFLRQAVEKGAELLIVAVISIASWWLFEMYNAPRFWRSDLELWWHYHNLESNPFLRRVGYDWAFATISPAMFETAEFFGAAIFAKRLSNRAIRLSRSSLYLMMAVGALAAVLPLIVINDWLVPLVWLSFIFLLDPINALRSQPSIIGDLGRGDYRRLLSLLAGGGVCGVLWEFWNYWAISKWTYTVPYFGDIKLFEMPVLGFLGFPPFALECWVIYVFVRGWGLGAGGWWETDSICAYYDPIPNPQPPIPNSDAR